MKYNTILQNAGQKGEELKKLIKEARGLEKLHNQKGFNCAEWEKIKVLEIKNGFTIEGLSKLVNFEENNKAFIIECKNAKGEKTLYNDFDLWDDNFCWFTNCNNLETYRKNKKHNYYTYNIYILIQNKKYCDFRESYKIDYKNERFIKEDSSIYTRQNKKYITSKNDLKIDKSGYILPVEKMRDLKNKAEQIRKQKQLNQFLNYSNFENDIQFLKDKKEAIILLFNNLKNKINTIEEFNYFIKFYNCDDYKIINNKIDFSQRLKGIKKIIDYIDNLIIKINNKNYYRLDCYIKDIEKVKSWNFENTLKEFKKIIALDKIINHVRDKNNLSYIYSGDLLKNKIIIQNENNFIYNYDNKKYIINFENLEISEG